MKYSIVIIATFLIILTSCSLLGSDDSNNSDIPGKIVFAANDSASTYQIFTMQANGSQLQQLTELGPEAGGYTPSWNPDGTQIIFSTPLRSSSNGFSLYLMNADGTNMRALHERENSHIPTPGSNARWSPDGTKIVFDRCVNCQIGTNLELFVYDFETDAVIRLTNNNTSESNPSWSPDGQRIAFTTDRDYFDADSLRFRQDLYVIDIDGSNLQRLTETGYARQPLWFPGGSEIIFRSTGSSPGLYKINIISQDITMIKEDSNQRTQLHPNAWAPDGGQLLIFTRELDFPRDNSLNIFDLRNNETKNIFSKASFDNANPVIQGADWFIPIRN